MDLTDEQIGAYWDRHLAEHVADIPDPDARERLRARYIEDVRRSPAALEQLADAMAAYCGYCDHHADSHRYGEGTPPNVPCVECPDGVCVRVKAAA